jgi:hypothetical protein
MMRGLFADNVALVNNMMNWCTTCQYPDAGAVGAAKAVPSWVLYTIVCPFTLIEEEVGFNQETTKLVLFSIMTVIVTLLPIITGTFVKLTDVIIDDGVVDWK